MSLLTSRTCYVVTLHDPANKIIHVVNLTYGTVYAVNYKEMKWFSYGCYDAKDTFHSYDSDIQVEVSALADMSPTLKAYITTWVETHVVDVETVLTTKYETPVKVAQVIVAMGNLAEDLNPDHAVVAIATYLGIPHQWCLDACNGLVDPYFLAGYIGGVLCPTQEAVKAVWDYLPTKYLSYLPVDEGEEVWDDDCQDLWDLEYPYGTPTL
ncbi:PfWMP4_04 [Phormidium phage Pf-WMP4]|uniref:PfWMP4_04 n=1 Tax=Phormidium phage Pf-WMP4 TaxID=2913979 RepID=Q0GBW2_9CAUD|nr:PfWMP4_04 [Phormidium phage Pf-WMP4]ABI33148.1 PfWMP4_04 [Phormidium phage Pf-WMP4]